MSTPPALEDRLRLQRWIAAIGLTVAAEDAARADTPETNAMALLGAHAACESLLGLLAGVGRYRRNAEPTFANLLDTADKQVKLAAELRDDLEVIHRARNGFVHASNSVHANEAARATSAARRLMNVLSITTLQGGQLPAAAGIGTAVADIIETEAVGIWLRNADASLAEGQVEDAADDCARALDAALARTNPRLRHDRRLSREASNREMSRMSAGVGMLDRHETNVAARIEGLAAWIVPLALGLPPAGYDSIRATVGSIGAADLGGAPAPVERRSGPPSEDAVRRALSTVSQVIFRLWAIGSLRAGQRDDQIVQRAEAFLKARAAGDLPAIYQRYR